MHHADQAENLFAKGYNCAQAVFGAFAGEAGMDDKTAMRVASSLGGGIAHTGEACGAALGMCLALGLAEGYDTDPDQDTKNAHNARVKTLMEAFRAAFDGRMDCDDMRVVGDRTVCVAYVRRAAELVEEALAARVES